jgi:ferredoxin
MTNGDFPAYTYRDGSKVKRGTGYRPHTSTRFLNFELAKDRHSLPELYSNRSECCGCTACVAECPVGAITMCPDEEGFDYPVIDAALCVCCRKCLKACAFKERIIR